MTSADVFLFPSFEGAGMVVVEAMARGCPVVCLDVGGPGEMVDETRGLRVSAAGTFDDPNWFSRSPDVARHIFLESAQHGTMIPAGMPTYQKHATRNDGTPAEPEVFDEPHIID